MPKTQLINGEPDPVRTRKVEITMPEGLYDLLERVCEIKGVAVADFLLEDLIESLGCELDDCLGNQLSLPIEHIGHREYVESLARPEKAAQEVQV